MLDGYEMLNVGLTSLNRITYPNERQTTAQAWKKSRFFGDVRLMISSESLQPISSLDLRGVGGPFLCSDFSSTTASMDICVLEDLKREG